MPVPPPSGRPRHAAPADDNTAYMQRIAADDRLIDQVGRGDYASADPLGSYLGAYRDQELARAKQHTELTIALATLAVLVGLLGITVICFGAHVIGVVLLAFATEHAAVIAVLNRDTGRAR